MTALCSPDMEAKVRSEFFKTGLDVVEKIAEGDLDPYIVVIPHWPRGMFLVFSGTIYEMGKCLRTAYPKGLPR